MIKNIKKTTWSSENNKDYYPNSFILKSLPSDIYISKYSQDFGEYFSKLEIKNDIPIDILKNDYNLIKKDLDTFWSLGKKYKNSNIEFNRAVMLHGEPGCGKKYLCRRISEYFVKKHNGIVIYSDEPADLKKLIKHIKTDDAKRKILVVIENAGVMLEKSGVSSVANLFKDNDNEDGVYYLITTNFEDKFSEYVSDKPGYIEKSFFIDYPDLKEIESYLFLLSKNLEIKIDVSKISKDALGLSLGHIKNLIESVYLFEYDYEDTLEELVEMKSNITKAYYSSSGDSGDIGFDN